jgi:hypothetical protein
VLLCVPCPCQSNTNCWVGARASSSTCCRSRHGMPRSFFCYACFSVLNVGMRSLLPQGSRLHHCGVCFATEPLMLPVVLLLPLHQPACHIAAPAGGSATPPAACRPAAAAHLASQPQQHHASPFCIKPAAALGPYAQAAQLATRQPPPANRKAAAGSRTSQSCRSQVWWYCCCC